MGIEDASLALLIVPNALLLLWGISAINVGLIFLYYPELLYNVVNYWFNTTYMDSYIFYFLMSWTSAFGYKSLILFLLGGLTLIVGVVGILCAFYPENLKAIFLVLSGITITIKIIFVFYYLSSFGKIGFKNQLIKGMSLSYRTYLTNAETINEFDTIHPQYSELTINETFAWFRYQTMGQCCGVKGNLEEFILRDLQIPPSCCQLKVQNTIPRNISQYSNITLCMKTKKEFTLRKGCGEVIIGAFLTNTQPEEMTIFVGLLLTIGAAVASIFAEV